MNHVGGFVLLACGIGILVLGFGVLKARRFSEIFATVALGAASLAAGAHVLIS